jgi:large subunit ribosomal protein L7/L12
MASIPHKLSKQFQGFTHSDFAALLDKYDKHFPVSHMAIPGGTVVYYTGVGFSTLVEEEVGFDVILEEVPVDKRLAVLKALRSLTELRVKQAKDLVESIPTTVKECVAKAVAEAAKKQLEDAGAKVTISKVENRNLIEESVITEFSGLDNSETLIREIDNLLNELLDADDRITKNQASIDSLKLETKEMLATLHAMVG